MSTILTWVNIECIRRNGYITGFVLRYGKLDGALTLRNIGNSYITSYTVDGLLPFTEYRFQVAGQNMNGTGPYTTFISIRTDEDGKTFKYVCLFLFDY